jgi:glutathione synthase/RimK-type ligase-like ATP-grasp enzyme
VSVRFGLIANRSTPTSRALCCALLDDARWAGRETERSVGSTCFRLDGVDDGLWALGALAARGVHVLNDPAALLAAHDKLLTARLLRRSGIPHPTTHHVRDGRSAPPFDGPMVVKPRFGSWGRAVHRCDDARALEKTLARVRREPWFERHGALVQRLVPPEGIRPPPRRGRR